jgi:hypothetical protein
MSAIGNATTTTSIIEIVNSEVINGTILDDQRPAAVSDLVAWRIDCSAGMSKVHTIAKWTSAPFTVTEASPVAETDELTPTEQLLTEIQVTAVVVGIYKYMSDEAAQDALIPLATGLFRENTIELGDQLDEDLLLNIQDATNTETFTGAPFNLAAFGTSKATYKAQNPNGTRSACVLHGSQVRDLASSVRGTTGAIFGGAMGPEGRTVVGNTSRAYLGQYEGFEMYEANNVPAQSSDYTGAMMAAGERGALVLCEWTPVLHEAERVSERKSTKLVTTKRYGTGITDNSNLLEIVSQA